MSWNVLHVKPRCEKKLAEFCRIYGYEYYLPLRLHKKVYQRRKVEFQCPVFQGYVFASFDAEGKIDLLKSNSIIRIIEPGNEAALIFQLDQVRKALSVDATLGATAALKKGKKVKIIGGPFMGVEGVISDLRGASKLILNVEMINRAVVVEVDTQYIELTE